MLTRIQRQVHRNPTLGVLMTLALWWSVTCLVAYSLRSSRHSDVDDVHPLGLPEEKEISSQQSENFRRQRFLRRNRHVNEDHRSSLKRHSASQNLEMMMNTTELNYSLKELFLEHEKLTGGLRPTKPRKRHQFFNKLHMVEENIDLDNISQGAENFEGSNRHLLSIRSEKNSDFKGISSSNYDFKKYDGSGRRLLSTRPKTESEIYGEPAGNYGFMSRNELIKNDETSFFVHTNPDSVTWRTLMSNVCKDTPEPQSYHGNISSLVKYIETIIKILVYFSRSSFKVIFITESQGSYDLVLRHLNDWPPE
ncbi:uncharacterized protein [Cherax quadricarinatus]|uniref:uncharacterized protein n=1 Tax=Cherax quadricarinatus TaxID=27406 RepID=UPI00387ECED3